MNKLRNFKGYTIVELLVVIVVIAVLAAVSVVAYVGITSRAVQASVLTDLDNATKQIKQYQGVYGNGKYPVSVTDCPNPANGNICLKSSGSNKFSYKVYNTTKPKDFRVTAYNESEGIYYSNNASNIKCPMNFVIVPGSSLYGTNDFCAMKYEARQASATVPVSKSDGLPWANIMQDKAGANNDAMDYSKNVVDCNGCHLISEAEWMTITHDLMSVNLNWSSGNVGSGYIYRGHSDSSPIGTLAASRKDSDSYIGTGNAGDNQRRALALSNGEVIWDIAGNLSEWTSGTVTTGSPGVVGESCNVLSNFVEWEDANASTPGSLTPNPSLFYMTDITNYQFLNSSHGIGLLCSDLTQDWSRGIVHGGSWTNGAIAGVLATTIYFSPSSGGNEYIGFRAAR